MANPEEIKKLKESGWNDMEVLLDQHMPTKKRKIFPWFIAASLILLMSMGYYFLQPTSSPTIANHNSELNPTSLNSNKDLSIEEKLNNIDNNDSTSETTPSITDSKNTVNKAQINQTSSRDLNRNSIEPTTTLLTNNNNGDNDSDNDNNHSLVTNPAIMKDVDESKLTAMNHQIDQGINSQLVNRNDESIILLPSVKDQIQDIDFAINNNLDNLYIHPIDHRKVKTKFFIMAGDHISSANDIHYLHLSPGVSLTKSKWTAYLAAGLQLTAPSTKTINKENSPLFDQLDIENSKQLDFANSGSQAPSSIISNTTYYQKLRFNPGINTTIGLAYALTPKWDIDWSIGHYWLTYNHEYKYIGTNAERLQVEANNINTNLSYSSLKLSYHLSSNLKIQVGTAFANIFKPKSGEWQLAGALAYTF